MRSSRQRRDKGLILGHVLMEEQRLGKWSSFELKKDKGSFRMIVDKEEYVLGSLEEMKMEDIERNRIWRGEGQ